MKTIQILLIKPNTDGSKALNNIFNTDRFDVTVVNADEAAVEQFCQRRFDVIVIGKEWGENEIKRIDTLAHQLADEAVLIRQENDDDESLKLRIEDAYRSRQRDTLHHIKVNDTLDSQNLAANIRMA